MTLFLLVSGIYWRLRDGGTPWCDRVKLARYAWSHDNVHVPNKHQALLDWLTLALTGKKRYAIHTYLLLWNILFPILSFLVGIFCTEGRTNYLVVLKREKSGPPQCTERRYGFLYVRIYYKRWPYKRCHFSYVLKVSNYILVITVKPLIKPLLKLGLPLKNGVNEASISWVRLKGDKGRQ